MKINSGFDLRQVYPGWPSSTPEVIERVDTVEVGSRGWVTVWHYGTEEAS